jgi:hypothetical protein
VKHFSQTKSKKTVEKMVRLMFVLVFGLVAISCSLASPFESAAQLIATANQGKALYGRYLQWIVDQSANSDKSFARFYELIKGEKANRQFDQREVDEGEPDETVELGHDNGELQSLYEEWKAIQPEGSSTSFESYFEWLKDQKTVQEVDTDAIDTAEGAAAIEKRACSWGCSGRPVQCSIRCNW